MQADPLLSTLGTEVMHHKKTGTVMYYEDVCDSKVVETHVLHNSVFFLSRVIGYVPWPRITKLFANATLMP